jgi:hypothetical protein
MDVYAWMRQMLSQWEQKATPKAVNLKALRSSPPRIVHDPIVCPEIKNP